MENIKKLLDDCQAMLNRSRRTVVPYWELHKLHSRIGAALLNITESPSVPECHMCHKAMKLMPIGDTLVRWECECGHWYYYIRGVTRKAAMAVIVDVETVHIANGIPAQKLTHITLDGEHAIGPAGLLVLNAVPE